MKKLSIALFLFSFLFFGICIFFSSPYRELRPYFLYNLINSSGREIKKLRNNDKAVVMIQGNEKTASFYMDQRLVTIGEYKLTAPSAGQSHHYRDVYTKYLDYFWYRELPVSFVTWNEAHRYCQALGGDLPDERQWELAADSSSQGLDYAWGNDFPSISRANLDGYYQSQIPSGWLPEGASESGILDLNGNVREWILDDNPDNPDEKSLKGAAFQDSFSSGKNDSVFFHDPASSGFNRGFRCVYPADAPDIFQ